MLNHRKDGDKNDKGKDGDKNDKESGERLKGRAPLMASDLRVGMKLYLKRASGVKLIEELEKAGVIVPHQGEWPEGSAGMDGTAGGTARENLAARLAWEVIKIEAFEWSVVGFDSRPAYRVQFRVEGPGGRVLRTEEYFINNEVGYSSM